ncbi:winged helix-turn-helix domain-containing protein [uncultured Oscillibacter sp.]|uniref:winged helix-turn-helix domain-containing protein n=1 Tax=uncultured Oscillibacter sp. TaxID=876091 RepID=UPI0026130B45|nr:LysR family transcriptional regulator [uncultured Oscillibacter sp.]
MNHSPDLRLAVTLRLLDGEGQRRFGPGVAALLEEVREKRSLRAAAGSMGMAYSKAWRIVRTAEDALGYKLLDSTIGGRHGGGAALTEEAEALLAAYQALREEVDAFAQKRFQERFRDL